jgi:hypothetical protein
MTKRAILLLTLCAALLPAQQTLVLDGYTGSLLGGWRQGKWIASAEAAKLVKEGETFQTPDQAGVKTATGPAKPVDGPCGDAWEVPLAAELGADAIAITTAGAFQTPKTIPSDARVYQIAFRTVLDQQGIRSPVKIDQLWQADLDGDGKPEVLASLYHASKPGEAVNQPGDYSLIAVRFSDAQKRVKTYVPIVERYTRGGDDVTRLRLGPLVDIDGDGKPELIVRGEYLKGKFTHVYRYKGNGKFERVLECSCGG